MVYLSIFLEFVPVSVLTELHIYLSVRVTGSLKELSETRYNQLKEHAYHTHTQVVRFSLTKGFQSLKI